MIEHLMLALTMQASAELPRMEVPDPKTVTTIEEAAEKCLLTQLNIDWKKIDDKKLSVRIDPAAMKDEGKKAKLEFTVSVLKYCIFGWAHDREVTLVIDGGQGNSRE